MKLSVVLPQAAGIYVLVIRGEATLADGSQKPFYLRSLPLRIVTQEELKAMSASPASAR